MRYTLLLLTSAAVCISCRGHEDIAARYRLEKQLLRTEAMERREDPAGAKNSERERERVMRAYRDIASRAMLERAESGAWNTSIARDIGLLAARANAARASLAYLSDRYVQPGLCYRRTVDDPIAYIEPGLRSKERLARMLYAGRSCKPLDMECEEAFRQLTGSDDFWGGHIVLRESVLDIPLVLARICGMRNDRAGYAEYDSLAASFYTRIIRVWPDSLVAEKARLRMMLLKMARGNWSPAIAAVDDMLAHPYGRTMAPELMVLKGFALAEGLNDHAGADELLLEVTRLYPESESAHAAGLERGLMYLRTGYPERGMELLHDIENDDRASDDAKSKAMLFRAVELERRGEWNESVLILTRIMRFFPATPAALEAPLIVTRHYVSAGDTAHAERNLERARAFYESLIESRTTLFERGYDAEDYLIENYILAGRIEDIARILATESSSWGWGGNAGAFLKSARIYAYMLDDRNRSADLLGECLKRFPGTRYARSAQRELDELGAVKLE